MSTDTVKKIIVSDAHRTHKVQHFLWHGSGKTHCPTLWCGRGWLTVASSAIHRSPSQPVECLHWCLEGVRWNVSHATTGFCELFSNCRAAVNVLQCCGKNLCRIATDSFQEHIRISCRSNKLIQQDNEERAHGDGR